MSEMSILAEEFGEAEERRGGRFSRITGALMSFFGYIGGAAVALLMIHVVVDVLGRLLFNSPAPATLEVSQYWYMPVLVFCGLPLAERLGEHINAPIVYDRLHPRLQLELTIVGAVLTVLVLLGMAWFGLEEALTQLAQGATGIASGVPIWQPRFIVPVACVLFAVEVGVRASGQIAAYRNRSASEAEEEGRA